MAYRRAVLTTDRPKSVLNHSYACGMASGLSVYFTGLTWSRASSIPCCRFHHPSQLVRCLALWISAAFRLLVLKYQLKYSVCASRGPLLSSWVTCILQGAFAILLDSVSGICEQFINISPVFYFTDHISDESHTAFLVFVSAIWSFIISASHVSYSGGSSYSLYRLKGHVLQ